MADGYTVFASSVAALTARVCTHPIDTIKTRLQADAGGRSASQSYRQWFSHTILASSSLSSPPKTSDIVRRLYRGLPVTLLFSVPALSVYLSCYESTKAYLSRHGYAASDHFVNHMAAGAAAETIAGFCFTPMEVLKNQLQTATTTATSAIKDPASPSSSSTLTLARTIYRQEGIVGFFRGYWMGLVVFLPHTMIYFTTYEQMKKRMTRRARQLTQDQAAYGSQLPWTRYLVCSSVASLVSSALSAPLDIIKTRWQVSSSEQGAAFRVGPVQIAKHMWHHEGQWRGFTKGLVARVVWAMPTTAISMTVFELLKDHRADIFA
ncbi:mitochondrial carrier domain-containing protein [Gongronella butleri]|nr:mitochondrial carrier domain-containing protein [Gongronella butleri]